MSNYRIEVTPGTRARIALTLRGRVREFGAGVARVGPWALGGAALFFAPDFIAATQQRPEVTGTFAAVVLGLAGLVCALWGWRRATRRAWLEVDLEEGLFVVQERTWLGGAGLRLEAALDEVAAVSVEPGAWGAARVMVRFAGGGEEEVGWGRRGDAELEQVRAAVTPPAP